ncbi:MAG: glycine--tRNA ligase subunit beta [Gammaproteobacteria bacterium]|nr:glycine--tRNA ligase subunit beta [Gammaproteobacteria bacterium]
MSQHDLLIEIGTEELPPKALQTLSEAFRDGFSASLKSHQLNFAQVSAYASPRRLALIVTGLAEKQADKAVERRGPALQAAFDAEGKPSKAASGFARSCGVDVADLEQMETKKGAWLVFRSLQQGQQTTALLATMIETALAALPIPKRMRWGAGEEEFVRPVHWVLLRFGAEVVETTVLGLRTVGCTRGHRFHAPQEIEIATAADYVSTLQEQGKVRVDYPQRRAEIVRQVEAAAAEQNGVAVMDAALLDEVTALVEWPVAVLGGFEAEFLQVPQEVLITTMQDNQKYFPLLSAEGKLMPYFITISNIESRDLAQVREGNERVIRPRFSDAMFFWDQDRKQTLASRRDSLKSVLFQKQLGTLFDKSERVAKLAAWVAEQIGADVKHARRAAELAKCDLMSDMVCEFTSLQGVMGGYYANNDGEAAAVVAAMSEQYQPRHAGDDLPVGAVGQALAIADKVDTLLGIFAIGQKPTGTKDPFALRRTALGLLRIMIERRLPLDLRALLQQAAAGLSDKTDAEAAIEVTLDYMLERLKAYYADAAIEASVVEAVLSLRPTQPLDFDQRVRAVALFQKLEAAESLAAANKRIQNILKKVEGEPVALDQSLFVAAAERDLFAAVAGLAQQTEALFAARDYAPALTALAALKEPVDLFFDQVMVMDEDLTVRANRIALLNQVSGLFLRVADLARLSS